MACRAEKPNPRGATGPRSMQGKMASSRNATVHGCTSSRLILPDEDANDWEELLRNWLGDYRPDCPTFADLVRLAAEAAWHLRRNTRRYDEAEQRLLEQAPDPFVWTDEQHKLLERFLRYKTSAERVFYRARNAAEQARKARFSEDLQLKNFAMREATAGIKKANRDAEAVAEEDEGSEEEAPRPTLLLQHGCVTVQDGQTKTYLTIPNDHMLEIMQAKRELGKLPIIIHRDLQFDCDDIPREYEWVKPLMETARLTFKPGKVMNFDPISEEEFLRLVRQQRAAGSAHWVE